MSTKHTYSDLLLAFKVFESSEDFKETNRARAEALKFISVADEMRAMKVENSPMKLAELYAAYRTFTDAFCSFSGELYLRELFELLSVQYPFEFDNIRKHMPLYDFTNYEKHNLLIKGDVQSGKTAIMVICSLCYLLCGRDVAVLCRNSLGDVNQFIDRFEDTVAALEALGFRNKNFRVARRGRPLTRDPCLFVYNYSEQNVKSLLTVLRARAIGTTVLFVDEADLRSGTQKAFVSLQTQVSKTVFVSATVQDILVSKWSIHTDHVVKLAPRPWYKGVNALTFIENPTLKGDELFYTLCDIAIDLDHRRALPTHPKIVLITIDRAKAVMDAFYERFKMGEFTLTNNFVAKLPNEMSNVCIISYTGEGIKMAHDGAELIFAPRQVPKSIGRALLWLAQNGGVVRFPNIVILAGDLASRGINFACYDSGRPENNWHLTHQILMNKRTCASAIQGLRILGNHRDDIPLKLYTTSACAEQIRKSQKLTDALVNTMANDEYKGMTTREAVREMPVRRQDKPEKYLTRESESRALKLVANNAPSIFEIEGEDDVKNEVVYDDYVIIDRNNLSLETDIEYFLHLYSNISHQWCRAVNFYRPEMSDRQRTCNWFRRFSDCSKVSNMVIGLRKTNSFYEFIKL